MKPILQSTIAKLGYHPRLLRLPYESRLAAIHPLSWHTSYDLLSTYKIQVTFSVIRSLPFIILFFILGLAAILELRVGIRLTNQAFEPIAVILINLLNGACLIGSFMYWEAQRRNIHASMDGLRLVVSRGVVKKVSGALIFRANDIGYLYQTPIDYLFGTWNVQIIGSLQTKPENALIPSLSREDAFDFFRYFCSQVQRQVVIGPPRAQVVVEEEPM